MMCAFLELEFCYNVLFWDIRFYSLYSYSGLKLIHLLGSGSKLGDRWNRDRLWCNLSWESGRGQPSPAVSKSLSSSVFVPVVVCICLFCGLYLYLLWSVFALFLFGIFPFYGLYLSLVCICIFCGRYLSFFVRNLSLAVFLHLFFGSFLKLGHFWIWFIF